MLTLHDFNKYCRKNIAFELKPKPINNRDFKVAVVIPVYNECEYIEKTLSSINNANNIDDVIIILVVNHPPNAPIEHQKNSFTLLEKLNKQKQENIFWIDLATIPQKGGVGKARKIGMDCVVHSTSFENTYNTIICSLDADCLIDREYFNKIKEFFNDNDKSLGTVIAVKHQQGENETLELAIRKYENYLNRYVEKLLHAKSPYAFLSIGSGFAVRVQGYVQAGGMRIREAGEDFYFLQALAKLSPLGNIREPLVYPSARISERVPFGTGPALKSFIEGQSFSDIPDYAFEILKEVLSLDVENIPENFPAETKEFFINDNFETIWTNIKKNTPNNKLSEAFHCYFDGLKTLRLLHFLARLNK